MLICILRFANLLHININSGNKTTYLLSNLIPSEEHLNPGDILEKNCHPCLDQDRMGSFFRLVLECSENSLPCFHNYHRSDEGSSALLLSAAPHWASETRTLVTLKCKRIRFLFPIMYTYLVFTLFFLCLLLLNWCSKSKG